MQDAQTQEDLVPLNPTNPSEPVPKYSRPPSQATASSIPEDDFKEQTSSSRKGFIIKVYGILTTQLLLTSVAVTQPLYFPIVHHWQIKHAWVGITLMVVAMVLLYAMVCYPDLCRKVPTNYILLGLFTFCESYVVSYFAAQFSMETVWIAAVATFSTVLGLTFYACVCNEIVFTFGLLFIASFLTPFLVIAYWFYPNYWMTVAISGVCCVQTGIYIIASTKMIVGGKKGLAGVQYSMDDYIWAAMSMYINIISLFMDILVLSDAAGRQKPVAQNVIPELSVDSWFPVRNPNQYVSSVKF